jgi:hypothetical protein
MISNEATIDRLTNQAKGELMSGYDVVLFIHLLGVVTLFIAIGIVQRAGANARRAESLDHLRVWLGFVRTTQPMFPAAALILLATGLYMAGDAWEFDEPWIVVGIVGLVGMNLVGPLVIRPRLSRIGEAAGHAGDGPVPAEINRLRIEPTPWIAVSGNSGAALGILWLMIAKPDWVEAVAVVAVLAIVGAVIGSVVARRDTTAGVAR